MTKPVTVALRSERMGDPTWDADHDDVAPFNDCNSLLTLVDTVSYYLFLKYVSSTTHPHTHTHPPARLPHGYLAFRSSSQPPG